MMKNLKKRIFDFLFAGSNAQLSIQPQFTMEIASGSNIQSKASA
jgi:hypothetical protein